MSWKIITIRVLYIYFALQVLVTDNECLAIFFHNFDDLWAPLILAGVHVVIRGRGDSYA
jgi:hypothetical protein